MSFRTTALAVGAAVAVALGGAGLYASSLSTTAAGNLGAGEAAAPASCTSDADVQPGLATYSATLGTHAFTTATVTADLSNCLGAEAHVGVIVAEAEIAASDEWHEITAADITAGEFTVTLDTAVPANMTAGTASWGVVITAVAGHSPVTNIVGVEANNTVALEWDAPTETGNSDIWGYKVEYALDDNGAPGTWNVAYSNTTSSNPTVAVYGLTNGSEYWFRVTPNNYYGDGPSAVSATTYIPYGSPYAPTGVTATPSGTSINTSWTAPSNNNGRDITGYKVSYQRQGFSAQTFISNTGNTNTSATITGLTSGYTYRVMIQAINLAGAGSAGYSGYVTMP
ncbi:MAG: fibronectin type III domain-containing protein [Actinobacteria bacterium]|nr:fibronectin type III domain-containing protein [Actinomycetota bacterium]